MGGFYQNFRRSYDSEINIRISWLWDGGIDVWIGDDLNGYVAQDTVTSVPEIIPWFQNAVAHFYPHSTYAKSLDPSVVERGASRLFKPRRIGAQVRCPRCGAPHASPVAFDQLRAFTCQHCGAAGRSPRLRFSNDISAIAHCRPYDGAAGVANAGEGIPRKPAAACT